MMRRTVKMATVLLLTTLLVAAALVGGILAGNPAMAAAEVQQHQIVVSGTGLVTVTPDQAKVSLGVTTMAPTARKAQQDNALLANQIIEAITGLGIPREKITTQDYSIWPQYSYPKPEENRPPVITAYQVNNTVIITIDDIKKIGAVVDAAVSAGANQVQSIQFLKKDTAPAECEALQKACLEARQKATAIAAALGVEITGVASVQESGGVAPVPIVYSQAAKTTGGGDGVPTAIEPGYLQVSSNVTITFLIK